MRVPVDRLQPFEPTALGSLHSRYRRLLKKFAGRPTQEILAVLDEEASAFMPLTLKAKARDEAAYVLTVRVLRDYVAGGFYPLVTDDRCLLVPVLASENLSSTDKKNMLASQYTVWRDTALAEAGQAQTVASLQAGLIERGYDARPVLERLGALDVSGLELGLIGGAADPRRAVWRAARMTWSMAPDASAPGREATFMVHFHDVPHVPLGIMQFRNVVPEIRVRDAWLGMTTASGGFFRLLKDLPVGERLDRVQRTHDVLDSLLASVQTEGLDLDPLRSSPSQLAEHGRAARKRFDDGRRDGRSDADYYLYVSKRADTASDLQRGRRGFAALHERLRIGDETAEDLRPDLDAGLRKIWHYHMGFVAMDMAVCGAAPPFGPMRVGKLAAGLAGSEPVVRAWGYDRPLGDIARNVYTDRVRDLIPNPGPLFITTSGLYPGHSAQYNRVRVGGRSWRKIGSTEGFGNSLISATTSRAARHLNGIYDGYDHIKRRFGEGASARFREVGRALGRVGVPAPTQHQINRPIYVLPLVSDPTGVMLGWSPGDRARGVPAQDLIQEWASRWLRPRVDELRERATAEPDLVATLGRIADGLGEPAGEATATLD